MVLSSFCRITVRSSTRVLSDNKLLLNDPRGLREQPSLAGTDRRRFYRRIQPNWASAPRAVVTTTVRPMTTCSAPNTGTGGGGRYASAM